MAHAFVVPEPEPEPDRQVDPVLRPYGELELPGSLYLSGLAGRNEVAVLHQRLIVGRRAGWRKAYF